MNISTNHFAFRSEITRVFLINVAIHDFVKVLENKLSFTQSLALLKH